ncbi:hypothetical protein QQ045_023105 [Rhodiola kirilowii]
MGTEHFTAPTSLCDLFHESELCPDDILTILQSLDDYNNSNILNMAAAAAAATPRPLLEDKNGSSDKNKKRKNPAKTLSSCTPALTSNEDSDEDHAVLSKRMSVKRQTASLSPPATSMEDGSALMLGDQASIIGGVIDYITEMQQVLQSLEAKKQRKIYTSEIGPSPRVSSSPRLLVPQQQQYLNRSPLSPRKPPLSPTPPLVNLPRSPTTPQSTTTYNNQPLRQQTIQPSSIPSPTSNSNNYSISCSSVADLIQMMSSNNNGVGNELVASSRSSVADVEVKFCGPNLELKILSSKIAGQSVKIVSAIEDLSLEILQGSINTVEETMLNAFTIKIGIECQLSAEELAQQIQQTFC